MTAAHLRPLNVFRDLHGVARLIQTCFDLDADGMHIVMNMHQMAENPRALHRMMRTPSLATIPLLGYVWEEDGHIVGNVSLLNVSHGRQRQWLIANVAVAPAFRRQGIARQLVQAALDLAHRKRVRTVWLQVKQENTGAQALYRSLGFRTLAVRTTWLRARRATPLTRPEGVQVRPRRRADWPSQRVWLERLYPPQVRWYFGWQPTDFQPSLLGALRRLWLGERAVRHWAAHIGEQTTALLTWQPTTRSADHLWLAAPPSMDAPVLRALVWAVERALPFPRGLRLNLPAGYCNEILQAAGFTVAETLCWMRRQL